MSAVLVVFFARSAMQVEDLDKSLGRRGLCEHCAEVLLRRSREVYSDLNCRVLNLLVTLLTETSNDDALLRFGTVSGVRF